MRFLRFLFRRRPRYAEGGIIRPGQRLEDIYEIENGYIVPVKRATPRGQR